MLQVNYKEEEQYSVQSKNYYYIIWITRLQMQQTLILSKSNVQKTQAQCDRYLNPSLYSQL